MNPIIEELIRRTMLRIHYAQHNAPRARLKIDDRDVPELVKLIVGHVIRCGGNVPS